MRNIEQYKNRFFNLMESTIGDVKPLISEQSITVPTGTGEGLSNSPTTNVDDLGSIIRQSDKDKGADNFCKTESGYDICLVKKNMDKSTMDKMYSNAVRRIEGAGYTKVKETETSTDTNKNYIKRSTWKKA
jgi:hypothetical protein